MSKAKTVPLSPASPPPLFSLSFIDYRSTAYYVIPLITLFFCDEMENLITRIHCTWFTLFVFYGKYLKNPMRTKIKLKLLQYNYYTLSLNL